MANNQIDPATLAKIHTAYAQAKACNLLAIVFAVCGFFIFTAIYQKRIAPDFVAALRDLSTLGLIVTAFLPAILLSFVAKRYEKKYLNLLKSSTEQKE